MTNILVGIPTLNGRDRLARVIASIEECTPFDRFNVQVLVCDDGSTESALEEHKSIVLHAQKRSRVRIEILMHNWRMGIAKSWNDLVRHTSCDLAVLLNDDVEVVDDWLDALVYSLNENPAAGMVGLNCYSGLRKVQLSEPHPTLPEHVRRPQIDFRESRMMGGCSLLSSHGYAFAFRRGDYDHVGGFDERFKCFYEELDFGIRLRANLSRHHYMLSYPTILHMGGATTSNSANMNASEDMANSKASFEAKWSEGSIGALRARFQCARECPEPMRLRHWNSQIRNWR